MFARIKNMFSDRKSVWFEPGNRKINPDKTKINPGYLYTGLRILGPKPQYNLHLAEMILNILNRFPDRSRTASLFVSYYEPHRCDRYAIRTSSKATVWFDINRMTPEDIDHRLGVLTIKMNNAWMQGPDYNQILLCLLEAVILSGDARKIIKIINNYTI